MSISPTGTALADDRTLALRETGETTASELGIELTPVAELMGADVGDHIDWGVDESEDEPMLVLSGIPDDQTADAPYPRQLREEDGEIVAPVPDPLVRAEPPEGLGLDLGGYDTDRRLLFDAMTAAETIGLVPVRFDDGEPYRAEPLPDVADDSDPVAEETIARERDGDPTPRPETMDAPIDPVVFDDVMANAPTDVPEADIVGILEATETHDIVGADDHVADTPPLTVDDRAVCLLEEGAWTDRIAPAEAVWRGPIPRTTSRSPTSRTGSATATNTRLEPERWPTPSVTSWPMNIRRTEHRSRTAVTIAATGSQCTPDRTAVVRSVCK